MFFLKVMTTMTCLMSTFLSDLFSPNPNVSMLITTAIVIQWSAFRNTFYSTINRRVNSHNEFDYVLKFTLK